eukprot:gene25718-11410_t
MDDYQSSSSHDQIIEFLSSNITLQTLSIRQCSIKDDILIA